MARAPVLLARHLGWLVERVPGELGPALRDMLRELACDRTMREADAVLDIGKNLWPAAAEIAKRSAGAVRPRRAAGTAGTAAAPATPAAVGEAGAPTGACVSAAVRAARSGARKPWLRIGFSMLRYDRSASTLAIPMRRAALAQPVIGMSTSGRVSTISGQCHR